MFEADLEQFRATRARTLVMIGSLTQPEMDYSPAPAKWSVGEVLDHLLLSEQISRRDIAELIQLKRTQRTPLVNRTLADFNVSLAFIPKFMLPFLELPLTMFNMFVPRAAREFLIRNRVVPAQSADIAIPRKGRSGDELRTELRSSLNETEALFEANPNLDYQNMISQHPLLGTNNVPQLLRLLALHEQRHQSQIADILADPIFSRRPSRWA
jgi:hypothetical protein